MQALPTAPTPAGGGICPIWDAARAHLLWANALTPGVFAPDAAGTSATMAVMDGQIAGFDAVGALMVRAVPDLSGVGALHTAQDGTVWITQ